MIKQLALMTSALVLAVTPIKCKNDKIIVDFPKCVTEANKGIRELYQYSVKFSTKKTSIDSKEQHQKNKFNKKIGNPLRKSGAKNKNCCDNAAEIIDISYEDAQILMRIAQAEAESEGVEGKARVIKVVINRIKSSKFPNTAKEVIFQKRQFSSVKDGRYKKAVIDYECHLALADVESGLYADFKALYFESKKNRKSWQARRCRYIGMYGRHRFYY